MFIDDPSFMIICLSYLKETKMLRIHKREILARNADRYYRVFENLINTSRLQVAIVEELNNPSQNSQSPVFADGLFSFEYNKMEG